MTVKVKIDVTVTKSDNTLETKKALSLIKDVVYEFNNNNVDVQYIRESTDLDGHIKIKIDATGIKDDDTLEIRMVLVRISELIKNLKNKGIDVEYTTDDKGEDKNE